MIQAKFQISALVLTSLLLAALANQPAAADRVIYASPDGKPGHDGTTEQDPKGKTLQGAIVEAAKFPNERVTIQLLTTKSNQLTAYQASTTACAFRIKNVLRSNKTALTIRGVKTDDGRWLTEIAGVSIADIEQHKGLCGISTATPPDIIATPSDGKLVHTDDLLSAVALLEAPPADGEMRILAAEDQTSLTRCFHVSGSAWIAFENLHFKDCWLPAVYAADSKNIALRGSLIEGSSYAFIAVSAPIKHWLTGKVTIDPSKASGFTIENNRWLQDTSGFGPDKAPDCREVNIAGDCPGDMWSKIPWGVTHDTLYEHMNGALFGSINIAGDVIFRGNDVRYAYNGLRMNVDRTCKADPECLTRTNANVIVADNHFEYIRDNPVEPEVRARNWQIYHNDIRNAHGWFSLDDVRDGPIYIWGNVGWFDSVPAKECEDIERWRLREKIDFVRGGYKKIPDDKELEPLGCRESTRGTVLKAGDKVEQRDKQIYLFHNSWRVRAPLVSSGKTGTVHHWNNAIHFTGCGPNGPAECRVSVDPDPDCPTMGDYFTGGDRSRVFACVDKERVGDPKAYDFHNDISNQALPVVLSKEPQPPLGQGGFDLRFTNPEHGHFKLGDGSDAIGTGCLVDVRENKLVCEPVKDGQPKVDVGAFSADGARYRAPAMPK